MYLIVNEERRIVAASPELLEIAGVKSVFDLLTKDEILQFTADEKSPEIKLGKDIYRSKDEALTSLFGSLTILRLEEKVQEEIGLSLEEEPLPPKSEIIEESGAEFTKPPITESKEVSKPTPFKDVEPKKPSIEEESVSAKSMENEAIPSLKEEGELEDILPLLLAEETKQEKVPESKTSSDEIEEIELPSSEATSQNIEGGTEEFGLLETNQPESSKAPSIKELGNEENPQVESESNDELLRIIDEELEQEKTEEEKFEDFSLKEHLNTEEFELLQKEISELPETENATEEPAKPTEMIPEEAAVLSSPLEENTTVEAPIPQPEETSPAKDLLKHYTPDVESNAKKLGLSLEEYLDLLASFVQESHTLEASLLSQETAKNDEALNTLYDAIALLHLDKLQEVLDEIRNTSAEQKTSIVETFYHWLDNSLERIRETATSGQISSEEKAPERAEMPTSEVVTPQVETPQSQPEAISEPNIEETVTIEEEAPAIPTLPENELFEDVQPVPIEFSVKIAAEELNLPEDLVLEFINDFATQGHEYLPVLIESYQNNDLDKLQKTAHMLKGAASNLRIEPMVENLYELQFDTDISRAPKRIKLFAGQLMSLDQYLQHMKNRGRIG